MTPVTGRFICVMHLASPVDWSAVGSISTAVGVFVALVGVIVSQRLTRKGQDLDREQAASGASRSEAAAALTEEYTRRVRLVRETGRPIAQVAKDLGINEGTLGNWVNADKRRRSDGNGVLSEDERTELARLRKENAELAMERDVLKRSVALWVKDAMGR
jgi:transposase